MIPNLSQEENCLAYDFDWTPAEKIQAPKEVQGMVPATPFPLNNYGSRIRSRIEVEDMECDEQTPSKKPRIDVEEDVINLEQEFNFEFDSLKTTIDEKLDSVNPTRGKVAN